MTKSDSDLPVGAAARSNNIFCSGVRRAPKRAGFLVVNRSGLAEATCVLRRVDGMSCSFRSLNIRTLYRRTASRHSPQSSLIPQPLEERQERQAEDGEVVALDRLE